MPPIIPEESMDYEPGVYLGEVKRCEHKVSAKGNEMFEMTWKAVGFHDRGDICTDYITFSKKAAGLTGAKLGVFGFEVGEDVKALDLIGKRAYLNIVHEKYEGRLSCKVGVSFEDGCRGGYWPEDSPPEHAQIVGPPAVRTPFGDVDDTPF